MSKGTGNLKSFNYLENGEVTFSVFDTVKTVPKLDVGSYKVGMVSNGNGSYRLEIKLDTDIETIKTHSFPDKEKLDNLFKSFFNKKVYKKINDLGFFHKVGFLLYGKEGTGKSTIIKSYCQQAVDKYNAIVLYIDFHNGTTAQWDFVRKLRAIQKNPIIVVIEEIDSVLKNNSMAESNLKKYFDGNESIDNCVIIGTTNYIDLIPDALKNRPSRFKYCLSIGGLDSESDIFDILTTMLGDICTPTEIVDFARDLKGSTLDVVKQFGIDKIMDIDSYGLNAVRSMGFTRSK